MTCFTLGPPQVITSSTGVSAVMYRPFFMTCVAAGSPQPYISWKKNDEDITSNSNLKVKLLTIILI